MARLYTCVLFNRRFDFAVSWPCQTSCGCRTAREQWRTHARTAAAPEPVAEPGKPVFFVCEWTSAEEEWTSASVKLDR